MQRCSLAVSALAVLVLAGCGGKDVPAKRASVAIAKTTTVASVKPVSATPDDAEANKSYATDRSALTTKAPAPGAARATSATGSDTTEGDSVSPGAPTDAEIAKELKQMDAVIAKQAKGGVGHGITLKPDGTAETAPGVPEVIAKIVAGGNAIAKFPYVYGGGHGSFIDTAYDCSGSVSYALASAGLLKSPVTSGQLAHTGAPGPGKWITIYANAGHTFMYVDGLRFDTSGRGGPLGTRWQTAPRNLAGFTVRHPPGL